MSEGVLFLAVGTKRQKSGSGGEWMKGGRCVIECDPTCYDDVKDMVKESGWKREGE